MAFNITLAPGEIMRQRKPVPYVADRPIALHRLLAVSARLREIYCR